jgi:hypothetical protein
MTAPLQDSEIARCPKTFDITFDGTFCSRPCAYDIGHSGDCHFDHGRNSDKALRKRAEDQRDALARECQRLREEHAALVADVTERTGSLMDRLIDAKAEADREWHGERDAYVKTAETIAAERDALRAQLAAMEAERDGAIANYNTALDEWHLNVQRAEKAERERDTLALHVPLDQLSVERRSVLSRAVLTEVEVVERIAQWLDDTAWNDDGFDDDKGDISEQTAALIVAEIRQGSWRAKEEG